MAEIRPLRAWRYSSKYLEKIEYLVSPLFDVVSEKQREKLYSNPLNSVHISVPKGSNPSDTALQTLSKWKNDGIIKQDELPSIYVYYQHFTLPGDSKEYCRKGFVADMKIYDWDEGILLRHENTMPHSVSDRMELLNKTQLNVSPTHGLYTDPAMEIEKMLDAAMKSPLYETEDYQGVRSVFAVIQDVKIIKEIIRIIEQKKIILADGHHRYEGSLFYKKHRENENPNHTGEEGYNYHMMWFTNTEAEDLRILPTHRLVKTIEGFDSTSFLQKIEQYFTIRELEEPTSINEVILGKKHAFGLLMGNKAYKIKLKKGLTDKIEWKFPPSIKSLDLTILHYFILEKCLDISGKNQRSSEKIFFERNFTKCHEHVMDGTAQCAIITQDISIETVKKVCYSGFTLPQKSTYFYPKVICGFLFGSIKEDEFNSVFNDAFN
jgi:uncharacterized protein (DUF1015 family)